MSWSKRLSGAAAVAALVAAPMQAAAASTHPAAGLSIARSARAVAPAGHGSEIGSGGTATLINVGILAALVAAVLVASGGDDEDESDSN
jgi:hypothetical protein